MRLKKKHVLWHDDLPPPFPDDESLYVAVVLKYQLRQFSKYEFDIFHELLQFRHINSQRRMQIYTAHKHKLELYAHLASGADVQRIKNPALQSWVNTQQDKITHNAKNAGLNYVKHADGDQ